MRIDGRQAFELTKTKPDLLVLDLLMPKLDGLQFWKNAASVYYGTTKVAMTSIVGLISYEKSVVLTCGYLYQTV
jgi:CheY-like chemotaxis protein